MPNYKEPGDPAEVAQRLEVVREYIVLGLSERKIIRHLLEYDNQKWQVSERQLRNYYNRVKETMHDEANEIDRPYYFALNVARLDYLYGRAVVNGDDKTANQIAATQIKLLRLDTPQYEMNWRKAAQQAGYDPDTIIARFMQTLDLTGVSDDVVQ